MKAGLQQILRTAPQLPPPCTLPRVSAESDKDLLDNLQTMAFNINLGLHDAKAPLLPTSRLANIIKTLVLVDRLLRARSSLTAMVLSKNSSST